MPALAATMAAAFDADPVFNWWIRDDGRRREILPRFFTAIGQAHLADEEVYVDGDGVAAAIWAPPDAEDRSEELIPVLGELAGEYADTLYAAFELMEQKHPVESHRYLFFLGTRPEWQCRGIGSAMMRPLLERCDADGVPAYLEATNERNVHLYLRHGFEITGTIPLPPDGPSLTCMWREPA